MESLRHVENYLKKIISNFIIGKMQLSIKNRFRSRYRHPPNLGSNRGQISPLRVTSHHGFIPDCTSRIFASPIAFARVRIEFHIFEQIS